MTNRDRTALQTALHLPEMTRPRLSRGNRGSRILVVEDHEDTAAIHHDILNHFGYEVHIAPDGHHALRVLESMDPDVLIVDIDLPGKIDGWAVIEFARGLDSPPPCIVTTALVGEEHQQKAARFECQAFMRKPIEPLELADAVEDAMGGGSAQGQERP